MVELHYYKGAQNLSQCGEVLSQNGIPSDEGKARGDMVHLLFLRSHFARDASLEIHFCVILQGTTEIITCLAPVLPESRREP